MLLVPTSILLRGNIWFIANCVIKLHQRERRLRLQRNQGELTKDIIFVGVLSKIEIWSKEVYEANDDFDDIDDIADHMSEFGLSF